MNSNREKGSTRLFRLSHEAWADGNMPLAKSLSEKAAIQRKKEFILDE